MRRRRDADESYVEGRRREPSHSKKRTSASSQEEETEFSILGVRRDGFRLHFTGTDGLAFRFSRETVRISFYIEYIITALPEFFRKSWESIGGPLQTRANWEKFQNRSQVRAYFQIRTCLFLHFILEFKFCKFF